MRVRSVVRGQLAKRAPGLERRAVEAQWRRRNRDRAASFPPLADDGAKQLLADLQRDGIAIGRFEQLFGSTDLFDEAAEQAAARRAAQEGANAHEPESAKPFLTKLLDGSFDLDDVFMRIALHPNVLDVANRYMGMRTVLRALDVWLTAPTPGPAIQTQLWHRDGDDLMNIKLFVLFSNVTIASGPLAYAPKTHPLGSKRDLPERDEHGRSTDDQMGRVVPSDEWVVAEGAPGTIVLADTCGYHKQIKPTGDQRLLLMSQYVSSVPYVPRALSIDSTGIDRLTVDQRYAVLEQP